MFPVKSILQQFDNVVTNRILRRESFGPGEEFAGVDGGLFNGEAVMSWAFTVAHLKVKPRCMG